MLKSTKRKKLPMQYYLNTATINNLINIFLFLGGRTESFLYICSNFYIQISHAFKIDYFIIKIIFIKYFSKILLQKF